MQLKYLKHFIRQAARELINKRVIYFISFPKSGRTWLELMFAKANSELSGYTVSEILNHKKSVYRTKNNKKLPKVIFGHGFLNADICSGNFFPSRYYKNKDIIFLARNPMDILISLFYYDKYKYNNFKGDLKSFIRFDNKKAYNLQSKRYGIKATVNYMNALIENRNKFKSFKIVYYEDLKQNVDSVMKDLFDHLELIISNEIRKSVISYGHIDNMRQLEQSNELKWYALQGSGKGSKVRKGTTGGYKEELSEGDIDFLKSYIKDHLNPFYKQYIN